jgi:hypothetical protein
VTVSLGSLLQRHKAAVGSKFLVILALFAKRDTPQQPPALNRVTNAQM